MLIRMLYITKISQPWFSLRYVDPKVVPHQNQSTMVLIQLFWPEGYTSPKSAQHCVHWNMLTRRLYLIKISSALCSFGICWPEGCTSPESVKCCVHWNMLTCRLYLPKISYALCSIRYVDPKVVRILVSFHQNKSSMVFIKILYVNPVFSGTSITRSLVYVYVL